MQTVEAHKILLVTTVCKQSTEGQTVRPSLLTAVWRTQGLLLGSPLMSAVCVEDTGPACGVPLLTAVCVEDTGPACGVPADDFYVQNVGFLLLTAVCKCRTEGIAWDVPPELMQESHQLFLKG